MWLKSKFINHTLDENSLEKSWEDAFQYLESLDLNTDEMMKYD